MRTTKIVATLSVLIMSIASLASAENAKNVILMISDGAGFNTFNAGSLAQHGQLGQQAYDGEDWVKYGCTNYSLGGSYDPAQYWSNFNYQFSGATDSAAAATALNSGVKTYNGSINYNNSPRVALESMAQVADGMGKATGTVSSVQFAHATPAAVAAHNQSRNNGAEIAHEMIYNSGLDVVIGAGNPWYDNNGNTRYSYNSSKYYASQNDWQALQNGTTGQGWTFVEDKSQFEAIASNASNAPDKLWGTPKVGDTFQCYRSGSSLNSNLPDLATCSQAALNVLNKDQDGFFLQIEGGAVDWAGHSNDFGRLIEEQIDFNNAVDAVVSWIETNSSWDDTLLIITADHETGGLWGDDADQAGNKFATPTLNGDGSISYEFFSGDHTNTIVPLYARGAGSELFASLVDGVDTTAGSVWNFSGEYVDNTDVFAVMNASVPEPATLSILGLGSLLITARRNRK